MCFHSKSSPDPCNEFYSKLSKHGCFLKAQPLSVIWGSLQTFSRENSKFQCHPSPVEDTQRPPVGFCVWAVMYEAVNQLSWMQTNQRETPRCIYKRLSIEDCRTGKTTRWWQLCVTLCLIHNINEIYYSSYILHLSMWERSQCDFLWWGFMLHLRFCESVPFKLSGKVLKWQCCPVSSCLQWTLALGRLPGYFPVIFSCGILFLHNN